MIHLAMFRLIRPNIIQQIENRALAVHLPVVLSNIRRKLSLPIGELAGFNIPNGARIGYDGFFFEITDEAVAGAWREEVSYEEAIVDHSLGTQDEQPHKRPGFAEFEEGEEVHSLIEGFIKESLNPSFIALETTEGVQVTDGSTHHAEDAGDGLEENEPDEPAVVGHVEEGLGLLEGFGAGGEGVVVLVARCDIKGFAEGAHGAEGDPVGPVFGLTVGYFLWLISIFLP